MLVTGNETVGIFECAKLVVNNQVEQTATVIFLVCLVMIAYIIILAFAYELALRSKYMKKHDSYDDYLLWKEHRKD